MKKEIMNLCLFFGICLVVYLLFRQLNFSNFNKNIEGMTDNSSESETTTSSSNNGIAGNAAAYSAKIKAGNIKFQDTFLISKYRSDYESIILNLDDLIDNLMLKTALTIDPEKPEGTVVKLSQLNLAKAALNNTMKFIDKK
jgi:hypothetical protein